MTLTQDQSFSREWNSDVYHRLSGPQVSWGKKVLSRLRLRGDEAVLDAGCGTGRLTAELLDALPRGRVVGIDLSRNMLRSAREHLAHFKRRANLVLCGCSTTINCLRTCAGLCFLEDGWKPSAEADRTYSACASV